jgi:anti-sigma regulatory factor (Ser/Thr protein kinase)
MNEEVLSSEHVSLSVPTRTEHIATVRGFLGAAGAHYGLPQEKIEDLKLAVSEICGDATESSMTDRIRVRIAQRDSSLDIQVSGIGRAMSDEAPEGDATRGFRVRLIRALIPDAVVAPSEDGMAVRFQVATSD